MSNTDFATLALEFAQVIALKMDDGWHYIAGARQALDSLNCDFPSIERLSQAGDHGCRSLSRW